jgi:hypothetical protein
MADTLVADLESLRKRWKKERPLGELLQLARTSGRWDVAQVVFEDVPDVWQALRKEEVVAEAGDALKDYEQTVQEVGRDCAAYILRSIKRLAATVGYPEIWRATFQQHLTQEELDKTFPLIS